MADDMNDNIRPVPPIRTFEMNVKMSAPERGDPLPMPDEDEDDMYDGDGWCIECGEEFHLDDTGGYNPPCSCGFHCRHCHDAVEGRFDPDDDYPEDDYPEDDDE